MLRKNHALTLCFALVLATVCSLAADKKPTTKRPTPAKSAKTAKNAKKGSKALPSGPYWPQWHGPDRNGISPDTGLLKKWPEGGPPLAWRASGLGAGFAGVSIADGRIFSMGDRDGQQLLHARELDGGKELWSLRVGDPRNDNYSGPRCTPAIDDDRVYAIGTHGDLVCADAATGKEIWRKSFASDFGGKMHSGWGFSESPLVDDEKLVCTPGGPAAGMVALDKKTGRPIWAATIPPLGDKGGDGAAYSSIVIGNGARVKQYVQLVGRGVVGVAADNGECLWGYNRIANGTANIPTPLVKDDFVFCSTGYQTGAALLHLERAQGVIEPVEVYFLEGKELQNHHGGMIMIGDYIYLGHGHNNGAPTCVHWKTGKIKWRKDRGPGRDSAAVAYADGNLYFRYQDGVMALIAAEPKGYELRGEFQLPDSQQPSWPHPVITGKKLYLRDQDNLFCYDIAEQ